MFELWIDVGVSVGFNFAVDVVAGLCVSVDGEFVLAEARKLLGLSVVTFTFEETFLTGDLLFLLEARLDKVVD